MQRHGIAQSEICLVKLGVRPLPRGQPYRRISAVRATLSQGVTRNIAAPGSPSRRYLRCIAAVAEHPRMLVGREPRHILYRAVVDVTQRLGISQ